MGPEHDTYLHTFDARDVLPTERPTRFLDLSCGRDTAVCRIVERLGAKWIGMDICESTTISVRADAHDLPFRNASVETVYAGAAIEHYRDPWRAVREVARILMPGGRFCGAVAFLQPWHGDSYFHCSPLGLREILAQAGFVGIIIQPTVTDALSYLLRYMVPYWGIAHILSMFGSAVYRTRMAVRHDPLRFAATLAFLATKERRRNSAIESISRR